MDGLSDVALLAVTEWFRTVDLSGLREPSTWIGALIIFCARVCDVSIGTIRMIYTIRGRRGVATVLAVFESGIFIVAISGVLAGAGANPVKMVGYACGYATGIYVGMSLENWIASGWTMLRIVTRDDSLQLLRALRDNGEAVTRVAGEGRDGAVNILFVVTRRKRADRVLALVRETSPRAFVTLDAVSQAIGGFIGPKHIAHQSIVRK